jgi:predicted secreted protein
MDNMLSGMADKVISQKLNPNMPRTHVEARKVLTNIGLDYKVYTCPCDQILFYGWNKDKISRYGTTTKKNTTPRKVSFL